MPRIPEKKVVAQIKKLLHSFDNCYVRKRKPYIKGDPDLTGCYNGKRIEIEVKAPDGHPTRIQEKRVADWKRLGCIAGIAWSVEDVAELIYEHLLDKDKILLEKHLKQC